MSGGTLMDQVYREIIMERSRRPRHRGEPEDFTHRQEGVNPSCGDELTLFLHVDGDSITDARFTGQGCAISQASADLMAESLRGLSLDAAQDLSEGFRSMIRGESTSVELGDLQALEGVRKLHARVKCATLPWTTLTAALGARDRS